MPAVLVFLVMVFVAVQAAHGLFVASTLGAVAHDAARVSAQNGRADDRTAANALVARLLPGDVDVSWAGSTPDVVRLTLTAQPNNFLAFSVGFLPASEISRTVEVRVEQPVPVAP